MGKGPQKNISPEAKKQAVLLVINSMILLFLYFGSMGLGQPVISMAIVAACWLGFAAFLIAYIAYNRAFTRRNLTVDMLPSEWTLEQKEEYIADGARRLERSRWMLSVIIPLLVTIGADAIYLFTWPLVQSLF